MSEPSREEQIRVVAEALKNEIAEQYTRRKDADYSALAAAAVDALAALEREVEQASGGGDRVAQQVRAAPFPAPAESPVELVDALSRRDRERFVTAAIGLLRAVSQPVANRDARITAAAREFDELIVELFPC